MLRQKRRRFRVFFKAFFISFGFIAIATGVGIYAMSSVRPPDVPVVEPVVRSLPTWDLAPVDIPPVIYEEPEEDIGFEYDGPPPAIADFSERKPLFFTFLIVGLTEGLNANTIMVAAYDGETRQGYIISIPRDTPVDVQRNNRKIVSAYNVGRLRGGGHEGGINRLKEEVQTIVGFRPDFYVSIDYAAFERMIDAVGGVEVYVPFHKRYDDPWQDLHIDLPAGLHVLDGQDALHFARYRTGNDRSETITDYQRIENQQTVISAMVESLMTPMTIFRIPEFIGIFNSYVDSDLSSGELLWFANQARNFIGGDGADALSFYTLPMLGTSGPPRWYELADEEGILELVNRTVNPFVDDITAADIRIVR
ncbi:MAG: LCP family protein [Defluviitaleaceae bacterium]|nr:LCP family protein [Defluviitaleaceae bacterium]